MSTSFPLPTNGLFLIINDNGESFTLLNHNLYNYLLFSDTQMTIKIGVNGPILDFNLNTDQTTLSNKLSEEELILGEYTSLKKNKDNYLLLDPFGNGKFITQKNITIEASETINLNSAQILVNGLEIGGSTLIQGPLGNTGIQGKTGLQGIQGQTGIQGETGIQGIRGLTGRIGIPGLRGHTGAQGKTGIQGLLGSKGHTGAQGKTGIIGSTGIQGIQGQTGIQGDTGAQGKTGIQGVTGIQGIQGQTGTQGKTGIQGIEGQTGIQGDTGAQGKTGIQGITGIGVTGPSGGPQGITGLQGITGSQGNTGPAGGPQGQTGIQGLTGLQGLTGIQGQTGIQGITGLGNTGLKGDTGIQGNTGPSGGPQGLTGIQGQTGLQGLTGIQGITGISITGPQGITGLQGNTGPAGGPQGQTGIQGLTGIVGSDFTSSTSFRFAASGAAISSPQLIVSGAGIYVPGKLTVDGLIDPTGLVLQEQSTVPANQNPGKGVIWVKNTTPGSLYYTDDAGNDRIVAGLPVTGTLQIIGGEVSVTSGSAPIIGLIVDTEGGGASDDLDTINNITEGQLVIVRSKNVGRVITVKNQTGNLYLSNDFTLTNQNYTITLFKSSNQLLEISRSSNAV